MPKWRKLHVKVRESLDVNEMPDDFTRLLWVLLPIALDREGRGQDSPAWVRSNVFPLRLDVTLEQIATAMDWLATQEMIERYQVGQRSFFWVPSFARYQGDRTREAESYYPAPSSQGATNSRPTQDLLATKSSTDVDVDVDVEVEVERDVPAAVAAPPPPAKRKRRSRADPRTAHPAIQAYRTAVGGRAYPKRELYDRIITALGDEPDISRLTECRQEWIARGFKPVNYAWLFEWYKGGIPTNGKGARASPLSASAAAIEAFGKRHAKEGANDGHS